MEVNDTDKREGDEGINGLTPTKLKKENKGKKIGKCESKNRVWCIGKSTKAFRKAARS